LRTPQWLAPLALAVPALLATPAIAQPRAVAPWPQYQGSGARSGVTPEGTPDPPYAVSWRAATGIGDPTQVLGVPTPIVAGDVAIVVGRESVDAVDVGSGELAWTVPRALGPSAPAAVGGGTLMFVEGGGEGGASSTPTSASPTPATTAPSPAGANASAATPSPSASTTTSTLVGVGLDSQEREWSVPLSDVSHSGVVVANDVAFVGADDGTVTAVGLDGKQRWAKDIGDHVMAPLAVSGDLVLAVVRPEAQGTAAVVALRADDGSQAWRYEPSAPVRDLGGPSVGVGAGGEPVVYVVGSDASLRAIDGTDGTHVWAVSLYSQTLGAPPAISGDSVVVADDTGTVYALDTATGSERWRFATNIPALGPPVLTPATVIQPLTDGSVAAISLTSGHEIWHTSISDAAVFGVAAGSEVLVASVTGSAPGLIGLAADPSGATEDVVSPTTSDVSDLVVGWVGAAIPIVVALWLLGRFLGARMGPAAFEEVDGEEPLDPWEVDDGE
jgi:outer membrane protein assembly factor BamB